MDFLLQLFILAIFSVLVVTISVIIFPDYIYNLTEGTKLEKFLENDLVKMIWILITVFGDALIIVWFCGVIA